MSKLKAKPGRPASRSAAPTASVELPEFLKKHTDAIFIGVIGLLLIIFFHEAFFADKVFNVSDNVSALVFEEGLIKKADSEGVNVFWNPYVFCGMPAWGSSTPGHGLYLHTPIDPLPPKLILGVYGVVQTVVDILPLPPMFWDIFNYFLLGLFTYFFALRRKFEPVAAFIVAVSVVFSLYSLNWIMAGHNTKITVFAWLPATFLLVDMLFDKRSPLYVALLVLVLYFTFNSGHIQMVFYNLLAVGLYSLYKIYEGHKFTVALTVIGLLVFSAAFAFFMLSGPYFATWEYKDFSIRGAGSGGSGFGGGAAGGSGGLDYEYATNWSFSPLEVLTFVVPSFVGFGGYTYWGTMVFTESPIYLGIVICTLALIGVLLNPRNRFVHFWIGLGVIALLISFGRNFGVLYDLFFYNMPFFNNFRIPSMILYLMALCVGMVAGTGISELIIRRKNRELSSPAEQKKITRLVWVPVGIAALLVVIFMASGSSFQQYIGDSMAKNQPRTWNYVQQVEQAYEQGQAAAIPEPLKDATREKIYDMAANDALIALVFMALTVALIWLFARGKLSMGLLLPGLLLLLLLDWWIVDYKPMHMEKRSVQQQALQKTDVVDFLQKDKSLYRIWSAQAPNGDNWYVTYDIQNISGYHPAKLKYYDDIRNRLFGEFQVADGSQLGSYNWALLSMLNTKYFIAPNTMPVDMPFLQKVFTGAQESVYQNQYVLPRAFFVGKHEVIENDSLMFLKIGTLPGYQPEQTAYLSKPLPNPPAPMPDSLVAQTTVTPLEFKLNSFAYEVETPQDALLKLSEIYYPSGWTATVDGTPVDIHRSDYALRAVVIPKGKHKLEMTFEPRSYKPGLYATIATNYLLGIVLLYYLFVFIRRRMNAKNQSKGAAQPQV